MSNSNIILMANQIAKNLARGHGDPKQAIAEHINNFWDPRMRGQLQAELQNDNGSEILEAVHAAKPLIRFPE